MAAKSSAFSRTLKYFQEANYLEAEAALATASKILQNRAAVVIPPKPVPRKRRTKVEMAEAAVAAG